MGLLVDGQWQDKWYDTKKSDGRFVREDAQFRHWLQADPDSEFPAQSGRYHLYVSLACPWAHRTLIMRELKGLADYIDVSVVHPDMLENGWEFHGPDIGSPALVGDQLHGSQFMHEVYTRAKPDYSGRVTVPVVWDKQKNTIVSNESAEIIRMFNCAFNDLTGNTDDYYPQVLRGDIDEINEFVYHNINNGVYKTGFATTTEAYHEAFDSLFAALDKIEQRLQGKQWLVGEQMTEADIRLFTTLVRFDAVYVGHFKCNKKRIADYPNLQALVERMYANPAIARTTDLAHIKRHYYFSHRMINATGIVPKGPELPWYYGPWI
ncbi:glutathione S-transferase family protein [Salinibius halmophilus]|uniref:glutathione S-transferase family protein n=1 Tax=Salinibius halmophilus TaxID=1853216 RepID=UPI000E675B4A|nr:glutathione S-transferase family protein [Salinibius halmophilus]